MHLMLALDESRFADAIIRWVRSFPHPVGTRLTLVYVLEPLTVPKAVSAQVVAKLRRRWQAEGRALLARAARLLRAAYPDIRQVLLEGFPIYEILRLIREGHPDIIVAGTRGLRAAQGLVLGSVSQRLLHYAPCSVMLIPADTRATARPRVMLATDGSAGAREAARLLTILPGIREVKAVTTVRPLDKGELALRVALAGQFATVVAQVSEDRRMAAQRALDAATRLLSRSDAVVTTCIATGHAAELVPRLAQEGGYNLLVVGSRGLRGLRAQAMGSVSLAVAQAAPCPVLVVKPGV
jgi:nucleotide-binding universal stress UspA family protein